MILFDSDTIMKVVAYCYELDDCYEFDCDTINCQEFNCDTILIKINCMTSLPATKGGQLSSGLENKLIHISTVNHQIT